MSLIGLDTARAALGLLALLTSLTGVACSSKAAATDAAFLVVDVGPAHQARLLTQPDGIGFVDVASTPGLVAAMNGGIFERPEQATGLLVTGGLEHRPLNVAEGAGNFFMKPNGVLFKTADGRWHILGSSAFLTAYGDRRVGVVVDATQSGPLLVTSSAINPLFRVDSDNRLLRNAACVGAAGDLHLLMSRGPCTFHALATKARELGCTDALYLDGVISGLWRDGAVEPADNAAQRYASIVVVVKKSPPAP